MRKEIDTKKSISKKALIVYGVLVFILILVSVIIRVISVVTTSKFDGQHHFTLALGEGDKAYGFISVEPQTSSMSILTFANNSYLPFSKLNRITGVIPDGYIKVVYPIDMTSSVPSILKSLLFNWEKNYHSISFYDTLQLWFYANKISSSTVAAASMPVSSEADVYDKTAALLFTDNAIVDENLTIKIINATGQSGLGSRLERVISNLGGNVVSVETGASLEPISRIQYGSDSYTLHKLKSLLSFRLEEMDRRSIAQIIIIIGKDKRDKEFLIQFILPQLNY